MAPKPETKLRNKIKAGLESDYGDAIYIAHPHGSMYGAGMLDLVGCLWGYFFSLEVKTPQNGKGATKLQKSHINRIRKAGGIADVVTSLADARGVIDDWGASIKETGEGQEGEKANGKGDRKAQGRRAVPKGTASRRR